MRRSIRPGIVIAVVTLMLSGCGGNEIKLVPAHGVVLLHDKPLAGATVVFVPESGTLAMGVTDHEGKFSLKTGDRSGVAVGKCGVSVAHSLAEDDNADLQGLSEAERNEQLTLRMGKNVGKYGADKSASALPTKFANPATSGLDKVVSDDPKKNFFEFKF